MGVWIWSLAIVVAAMPMARAATEKSYSIDELQELVLRSDPTRIARTPGFSLIIEADDEAANEETEPSVSTARSRDSERMLVGSAESQR